jgi:hypothetical protein
VLSSPESGRWSCSADIVRFRFPELGLDPTSRCPKVDRALHDGVDDGLPTTRSGVFCLESETKEVTDERECSSSGESELIDGRTSLRLSVDIGYRTRDSGGGCPADGHTDEVGVWEGLAVWLGTGSYRVNELRGHTCS